MEDKTAAAAAATEENVFKYACKFTLDPNTAHCLLSLTEDNRKVTWVKEKQFDLDLPDIEAWYPQVLCREDLTGQCYWEVDWRGWVYIGVTYRGRGEDDDSWLGYNDKSWVLECRGGYMVAVHNDKEFSIPVSSEVKRVGVYVDWPAGSLSFYTVYSDRLTHIHTFYCKFTQPLVPGFWVGDYGSSVTLCQTSYRKKDLKNLSVSSMETSTIEEVLSATHFTPDVLHDSACYRFKCPTAGLFRCRYTGLVFGVTGDGEVMYRTIKWDDRLLQSAGRTPAGPLFHISCPQQSLCQLHLPHCEVCPDTADLSVAHITDEGTSVLDPEEITESHVVINIPHLSAFGLIRSIVGFFAINRPIRSQVHLFLQQSSRQPNKRLNVHLLPTNVPVQEVIMYKRKLQQESEEYIQTPSDVELFEKQKYSVQSNLDDVRIQPVKANFYLNYGPNYYPTFEVVLKNQTTVLTLTVQDEESDVWTYNVDLPGPRPDGQNPPVTLDLPADERLNSARAEFIQRVSDSVLDLLLDKLIQEKVLNDEEMDSTRILTRANKARMLIDIVRKKGREASSKTITAFSSIDNYLSQQLNLS